ncbi:MAG: sugar transporter ATP-binding protein [Clostridiales bacterium]|nr:sugar transporter ATP-binding protein [Clostridiales bacterium]
MAKLSFKNLYKTYPGNVTAVKDFNLEIEDKEFIILVGPSGCGKSTTLRMIAGLEEISKGEISIDDRVVNDIPPKDRDIAMVFQNYALYPHMSVYDNMAFGLKLRHISKADIDEKVKTAAESLDISHLLNRRPKALSGGQRQRVALGRAIVREPKVFLMDEPLSNLDAKLRVQMRTEILKLHQKLNTTFIYVTHDQTEAMTMGTRIVVMRDGVIHQVDTPKNLYNNPTNMFVAGFIGTPQMNFMEGDVKPDGEGLKLVLRDGTKLGLSEKHQIALKKNNYIDKTIIMGLRPEHFHDTSIDSLKNNYNEIKSKIDITELQGAEIYLHLEIDGTPVVARVSSQSDVKMGDEVVLQFHIDRMLLFDRETEQVIA